MRLVSPMALSVMALLLCAACARAPAWNKPDDGAAASEQDTAACFRSASIQAQAQVGNGRAGAPQIDLRPSQGRVHDSAGAARKAASSQESALRNELFSQCMHRLGYRRGKP